MTKRFWSKIRIVLIACFICAAAFESSFAAPGYEQVAGNSQNKPVLKYGMVPIYGKDIKDGTYDIEGYSSSSFFAIKDAKLKVKDGEMYVKFNINSLSYTCIYLGTGADAAKLPESEYLFPDTSNDVSEFQFPIDALNQEILCTSFSKRREKWYDRRILFDASSLPASAVSFKVPDYDLVDRAVEQYDKENGTNSREEITDSAAGGLTNLKNPVDLDMPDGTYSIEVNMTGGSGRASVSSPTWLVVKKKKAYARLLWSSSYYDYMIIGGDKYLNETDDGSNSTFTIPITAWDKPVTVIADTTAMEDPLEIEYQLTFYKDTIGNQRQIPQEAAKMVLVIALVIIIVGGIINHLVKSRRKS